MYTLSHSSKNHQSKGHMQQGKKSLATNRYSRPSMARTLMAHFEVVLESLGKNPTAAIIGIIKGDLLLYIENGILSPQ